MNSLARPLCYWLTALLFFAAMLLLSGLATAATMTTERYRVRNWQTDEGLPQNPVWALAQTPDGYLWVGTQQGLVRFDGMRFIALEESAPAELKHGWIYALCAARDGTLWIGSESSGLWRVKDGEVKHFSDADGLPSNRVRCLLESRDGSLWIGTEGGVGRYKEGKFRVFNDRNGLGNNSVRALCEDRQGNIRAATAFRGLSIITDDGTITTMNVGVGATANSLKGVCVDQQGRIWVASPEGVTCPEDDVQKFYGVTNGLPSPIANVVFASRQGGVWVGTYNGAVCIQDHRVTSRPLNEAGFGDLVYTIFEDREDNLWIGARDGLYRLTPARFTAYTLQEGLACNNVMSVLEDKEGSMWFATWGGGVNELRDGKFSVYGVTNGLTHDKALALHEGRDGSMWIGMDHGGGLNRIQGSRTNSFPRPAGLFDSVRVIQEDHRGALWIGTSAGVHVYNKGKFVSYTTTKGLAGNVILALLEDTSGSMWIGTDDGLSQWSNGKFTNYRTAEGLSHNAVEAIYEDADGSLWIGTRNGLNRWRGGKFKAYTSRDGLFSDEIYEILEDDFGYFWMSCRTGIFRVKKDDFNALDRGLIKTVACTAFGKSDGLPTVQCNGIAKPAGWKSRDGRLWFPTIRGVVAVESRIKTNDRPPPVAIEEVIVDRKYFQQALVLNDPGRARLKRSEAAGAQNAKAAPLEIPPSRGELEIHYAGLSLQSPDKNQFKYKLDGVDSDWIDGGTRREAFYANVGPGNYQFHVLACNNDGVWSEQGATLALVFLPHYWQTNWFRIISLAGLAAIMAAFYRSRVARLREIEALRIQIAADLHDDVGARLTKIAMVTEHVDGETAAGDRNKGQIGNIARTTHEVIRAMDEIVWTINPSNDTLDNLANYLFQHTQEYFQNTGVRCRLDFPVKLPDYHISTEERHNLFMAVKEALNNVLKHSHATEVRVSFAAEGGRLLINIADNGQGFVPGQERSAGEGLRNMKQRLDHIGGKLRLESTPGQGTKVHIEAKAG